MMEKHYKIGQTHVSVYDDTWKVPCLCEQDGGLMERGSFLFRVNSGQMLDARSVGSASEVSDDCALTITLDGPVMGWGGDYDGEQVYRVGPRLVAAHVLDKIAEWTGLQLPTAAK